MSAWKDHWPLARRWAFFKPRLLPLRQQPHEFQVDFRPLPDIVEHESGFWLGLVVDPGLDLILARSISDEPPTAHDLAEILVEAMQCPLSCGRFRPEIILLRDNPEWERLFPLLGQVGIETVVTEDLLSWDAKAGELIEWLRDRWLTRSEAGMEDDDQLTVPDTLLELRILAIQFLFFEQGTRE